MSCYQYLQTLPLPGLITRVDKSKKWLVLLYDFLDLELPEPLRGRKQCSEASSLHKGSIPAQLPGNNGLSEKLDSFS